MRWLALLVAVAACSAKHAAEPREVSNTATEPERRECKSGTIVERVCGPALRASCGRHGDTLAELDITELVVTDLEAPAGSPMTSGDRAMFRSFSLDAKATREYQQELTEEAELTAGSIARHCCYSQCAPLDEMAGYRAP